tara:strand:- start:9292 stop:9684 length:393 start_codon:yes stop_codon:yes gene_type:complete
MALDIRYPRILTVIAEEADRDATDHVICCMGMADDGVSSLTQPLAATSAGPATDWGLSTVAADTLIARLALTPQELEGLGLDWSPMTAAQVAALKLRLVIDIDERETVTDVSRMASVAAGLSLALVEVEA